MTRRGLFGSVAALLAARKLPPSSLEPRFYGQGIGHILGPLDPTKPWFIVTPKTPDDAERAAAVQAYINRACERPPLADAVLKMHDRMFEQLLTRRRG